VRVHRDGRLAESDVENHVRGLSANTWQRFERLTVARHLPTVHLDE
jgi:hypothetical protein